VGLDPILHHGLSDLTVVYPVEFFPDHPIKLGVNRGQFFLARIPLSHRNGKFLTNLKEQVGLLDQFIVKVMLVYLKHGFERINEFLAHVPTYTVG
jgi:hypothetical protein